MNRRHRAVIIPLLVLAACAPVRPSAEPGPGYLRSLACRIVSISDGQPRMIQPLADVNLDTVSGDPADYSFGAAINGGRTLGAAVRHVKISLPRDRFNVALMLDGKTHLRMNHVDLDIYVETVIEGRTYALHCFPEIEMMPEPERPDP